MEQKIEAVIGFLTDWLNTNVLTWNTAAQWAFVIVAFALTSLIWRGLEKRLVRKVNENVASDLVAAVLRALVDIGNVVGFILVLQIGSAVFAMLKHVPGVLVAVSDLAVAWIVIRLLTSIMPNRSLARGVAVAVWTVAALHIFGLLSPITNFLQGLSFTMGEASFTALDAIKGILLAGVCLQAAAIAAQFASKRIDSVQDLSPSLKVLMTKAVKVVLFTAALLFAMSSVGINLTSLAIFSSALGVGIGFGLKTVFSNYVAGVLLLLDNSIKPGDTIEVGGVFGTVQGMHGRYASILTRDGMEYLVPNELLISGEVVNLTYSDSNVRLKLPVGISYGSDVEKAMELLEQATRGVKRVLRDPAPAARLVGFGDSSVDLQLRIWIADAERGVANVRSEVLLNVWNIFNDNGIEFPFPQRDVQLKAGSELAVTLTKEDA